jgi:hypothetical protein
MDTAKFSRRTYVVDRGFQVKYTLLLVGAGTFVSLLFGGMMYVTHINAELAVPDAVRQELARSDSALLVLMATVSVLMAGALGLFGILITHRVAGPIYVMTHYMSVLAQGRYPIMRQLRKNDELREFFQTFQDALETLRTRDADEAREIEEAVELCRPLATVPEALAAIERIHVLAQRKRDATDRVELSAQSPTERSAA